MAQTASLQSPMFGGDCPRCGQSHTTFDVLAEKQIDYCTWSKFETFLVCRNCFRPSIALIQQDSSNLQNPMSYSGIFLNGLFKLEKWVFEVPGRRQIPDHVPEDVSRIFEEAATCAAVGAWDAAGTMFRKVLDVATRSITPKPDSAVELRPSSWKTYKDLRLRLDWLFENNRLNTGLKNLSSCIHEDGNDAAHDANGITKAEAEDLADFTTSVLETLYTIPGQIAENQRRRDERRGLHQLDEQCAK